MTLEERLAVKEQRCKKDQQFRINLTNEIAYEYDFTPQIAEACVDKGWEDGHAFGYNEVRTQSQIAADFVQKIFSIIAPE